jgi:phenylpropionate dioxygenase-like ring-hydroxylating dioxygenase large terminal subunit
VSAYPAAVAEGWHPIATSTQLKARPLARTLMGRPIVAFRTPQGPAVLVDRCPHRNFALSRGKVRAGDIECPYHGWRFAGDGRCTLTPGAGAAARQGAEALPAIERAGAIWTTLAKRPNAPPMLPHPVGATGFDRFWWAVRPSRARLIDAVENLLDPAHPHFLHPGIVRSGTVRRPVAVTVRVRPDHAEAEYLENAKPSGLMPRLLEGLRGSSLGRFFPPATGQVAFEGGGALRLAITVFFTPIGPDRVQPFAHFATPRGLAPAWLKQAVLRGFHVPVLSQDQAALRAQAENIARFGAPRYALGPLDVLLPAIRALAAGETPQASERQLTMEL